jgi:hypothetical protein
VLVGIDSRSTAGCPLSQHRWRRPIQSQSRIILNLRADNTSSQGHRRTSSVSASLNKRVWEVVVGGGCIAGFGAMTAEPGRPRLGWRLTVTSTQSTPPRRQRHAAVPISARARVWGSNNTNCNELNARPVGDWLADDGDVSPQGGIAERHTRQHPHQSPSTPPQRRICRLQPTPHPPPSPHVLWWVQWVG